MNSNSVAHTQVQNQQRSSWTDDAFSVKGTFKGRITMTSKRTLSEYAEELAYEYGKYNRYEYRLNFSDLPEEEQNELARQHIELTGRDIGECIHGNDLSIDGSYTCALLAMLQDDCQLTRETLATVMRKNILIYYTKYLQEIIDDACHNLLLSMNEASEFHTFTDDETGEPVWKQF